jgi:aspartyl-tRNA(Asn)/glutamyl-tRNA(Gln) amidotransferase subunit C
MAVSLDDVKHVAALARIAVDDARAQALVSELNGILAHMDVLSTVNVDGLEPVIGVGAAGAPLRADHGPAIPLVHPIASFAPRTADGFFLVPRLATHEDAEQS